MRKLHGSVRVINLNIYENNIGLCELGVYGLLKCSCVTESGSKDLVYTKLYEALTSA